MKKIKEATIFPQDRSELTLEKLRKYPGFENVQEGEAESILNLLKRWLKRKKARKDKNTNV